MTTPLIIEEWTRALHHRHPDQAFAEYILNGLKHGFRIGFNRKSRLSSASANMQSAMLHPQVITEYLQKEISLERMIGPIPQGAAISSLLHINRFGVIPKGHNTGKWRLITDLSHPAGKSVNDGIDPEFCSLSYISVDHAARVISRLGRGSLLAKIDIEAAYRLVPVHPCDRVLQAVKWEGKLYVDPMLPFGLRSAPKIFNAIADAFQWHLQQQGIKHLLHYLDDYIMIGPPESTSCQRDLETLLDSAKILGIPISAHKTEGPTTKLVFLGIEIDTSAGQLRLPDDKLQRMKDLLSQWSDRKVCTRKELESLIGILNHACKVVRSGRSFLRRMIDLLHSRADHSSTAQIRLNRAFRADLAWWKIFSEDWNGTSFLDTPETFPTIHATSDASGGWGCGAWSTDKWFQLQWTEQTAGLPIAVKEMIPVVIGCAVWGRTWAGHRVIWHCDNQAVVACIKSKSSKHETLMHLIRNLVFTEAHWGFCIHPEYIDTHANHLADDLSRNRLSHFLTKVPDAAATPTQVPPELVELLLDQTADWISPHWSHRFKHTLTFAHDILLILLFQSPSNSYAVLRRILQTTA